ncbi:MAG: hypothetical protein AAGD92_13500 [Pseudomonadota bacterium]
MSKLDVTTQDLFLRLGPTSQSRSAKADAVFRRLRMEASDQLIEALSRAPRKLEFCDTPAEKPKRTQK